MADTRPEFPRPKAGDELIVVEYATRYRGRTETPVRVKAVARFRITLEGIDGEKLPWSIEEFDLRTQGVWSTSRSDRMMNRRGPRLHTAETLAYENRAKAAEEYMLVNCLRTYEMRGTLGKAAEADRVGFVNALRRFEGLEEI
jgi:hypothetical protein